MESQKKGIMYFLVESLDSTAWRVLNIIRLIYNSQKFRRAGWTETAIIVCKLNKSL